MKLLPSIALFLFFLLALSAPAWTEDSRIQHGFSPFSVTIPPAISVPRHLLFPGKNYLYSSNDAGRTWNRLHPQTEAADISGSTYITAAAINPHDPTHYLLGTSYDGLFESRNAGTSWQKVQLRNTPLYQGAHFYNEIGALLFSADGKSLFIRTSFDNQPYLLDLTTKTLRPLTSPGTAAELSSNEALFNELIIENHAYPHDYPSSYPSAYPKPPEYRNDNFLPRAFTRNQPWKERRAAASDKFGFFINAWQASTKLDEFIDYAKEQGFNSVVVDFKDDQGLLRYSSALEIAQNVGSVRPLFDAEELIRRFHDAGIYVIARMVVFKDKALYQYNNSDYAFWDSRLQRPWGVYRRYDVEPSADNPDPEPRIEQVEHWVDPYSAFVRNYNIQIARELEDIGVDEIQFDYIRFPSDGRPQDIVTRFLTNADNSPSRVDRNMERVRILAAFLAEARNSISIPIGTDVFGFNAWARMSYLGQDVEIISHYVDVISPMSYPSHYPGAFYEDLSYLDKAQFIYEEGTQRTREITDDRVIVRQYVQAFLIGGELRFEEDTYFSYLDRQLEGTIRGGGNGFTLWNNSGKYYMVNEETMSRRIKEAGTLTERK